MSSMTKTVSPLWERTGPGSPAMLKIIAGLQQPTSGTVAVSGGSTIGYLPQVMVLSDEHTVREEAEQAFPISAKCRNGSTG